jgi:hypothetical protein
MERGRGQRGATIVNWPPSPVLMNSPSYKSCSWAVTTQLLLLHLDPQGTPSLPWASRAQEPQALMKWESGRRQWERNLSKVSCHLNLQGNKSHGREWDQAIGARCHCKYDSSNMHKWWIADAIRLCDNTKGGDWTGNHHRLCLCLIPELVMDIHTRDKSASYTARW